MADDAYKREQQTSRPNRHLARLDSRAFIGLIAGALFLLTVGCRWTDANGTHHLIVGIGFGVITTTNRPGAEVSDSRVFGLQLGPDTVAAGYLSRQRVIIDPMLASNVVISVRANPFDLTVTHYDLQDTNWLPFQTPAPNSLPSPEPR